MISNKVHFVKQVDEIGDIFKHRQCSCVICIHQGGKASLLPYNWIAFFVSRDHISFTRKVFLVKLCTDIYRVEEVAKIVFVVVV